MPTLLKKFKYEIRGDEKFILCEKEIEFLKQCKYFWENENCYLKDLFTDDLINWIEGKIKNDFPVNLYEYYQVNADKINKLHLMLHESEINILDLNRKIRKYEEKIERLKKEIKNLEDAEGYWRKNAFYHSHEYNIAADKLEGEINLRIAYQEKLLKVKLFFDKVYNLLSNSEIISKSVREDFKKCYDIVYEQAANK